MKIINDLMPVCNGWTVALRAKGKSQLIYLLQFKPLVITLDRPVTLPVNF